MTLPFDGSGEAVIQVPAFNPEYFKSGMVISVSGSKLPRYNAIIESVKHQTLHVVSAFEGNEAVKRELKLDEVLRNEIVIRVLG